MMILEDAIAVSVGWSLGVVNPGLDDCGIAVERLATRNARRVRHLLYRQLLAFCDLLYSMISERIFQHKRRYVEVFVLRKTRRYALRNGKGFVSGYVFYDKAARRFVISSGSYCPVYSYYAMPPL
jgi:hypothetical protein